DLASDTPKVVAQPTNRSDSDRDDSDVLSMQSRAADTGASTPAQRSEERREGKEAGGSQAKKQSNTTMPDDTRAPVQEKKKTCSAREEKSIAADKRAYELNRLHELLDIKGANDVPSDIPKGVAQPTNRSDSDLDDSDVLSMQSPAADTGASTPAQ